MENDIVRQPPVEQAASAPVEDVAQLPAEEMSEQVASVEQSDETIEQTLPRPSAAMPVVPIVLAILVAGCLISAAVYLGITQSK